MKDEFNIGTLYSSGTTAKSEIFKYETKVEYSRPWYPKQRLPRKLKKKIRNKVKLLRALISCRFKPNKY